MSASSASTDDPERPDDQNELEASIMLSKPAKSHPNIPKSRRGFGLTLLTTVRNPARAVRALYLTPEQAPHAFLSGSESRWREHRRGLGLPEEPVPYPPSEPMPHVNLDQMPTGTVGAVALDVRGCIASVTSTGGRTNKLVGRIGDTPHMGSGFWAEEWAVKGWWKKTWRKVLRKPTTMAMGVSGTGDGDYFIRFHAAASIADRMKFRNESIRKASVSVVKELAINDGLGGVVALDSDGNVALCLNSSGMYRGVIRKDGVPRTAIFYDDVLE